MWSDVEKTLLRNHVRDTRHPLVVVVGPTASGKTDLAVRIGECVGGEVINADSRQFYRRLDIGTAKIRPEEARGIPHHLIDVLDPKEPVNIAWFQREARAAIDAIRERGKIPILAGGSMLYVSSIIDGLEPLPSDPLLRRRLEAEAATDEGAKAMHDRLRAMDPEAAAGIHPNNRVYLVRALELAELHGVKKSHPTHDDLLIFGMQIDRIALRDRVTRRTDWMFAQGWVEEVASLIEDGYMADDPGMESQGYREIMAALQSQTIDAVKNDQALRRTIVDASMRYAKRQVTWWKNDPRIRWIEA